MASGISNAVSTVWSGVKNVASSAVSWGKDIISASVTASMSGISFVGKAVKGVASAIESFLHFSVPDKDPLADADTYMPDFMKLLTKGITGKKDTVVSRVKDMVTKVKEQMLPECGHLSSDLFSGMTLPQMQMALAGGATTTTTTTNNRTTNMGGVHVTVYGYNAKNDDELAKTIVDKINGMIDVDDNTFKQGS